MNYFCISKHSIKKIWHVVILFPCKIPSFFIHKSPIEGKSQKEELVFFTIISLVFFVCEYSQKVPLCFISHFLLTAFSFACVQRFGSFFQTSISQPKMDIWHFFLRPWFHYCGMLKMCLSSNSNKKGAPKIM